MTVYRMKKLLVQRYNNYFFINPSDIIFITRHKRKTVIHTTLGVYETNESLEKLEQRLNSESFFRCHKGYIVNVEMVKGFEPLGSKTYVIKLAKTIETALVTLERAKEFFSKYCCLFSLALLAVFPWLLLLVLTNLLYVQDQGLCGQKNCPLEQITWPLHAARNMLW